MKHAVIARLDAKDLIDMPGVLYVVATPIGNLEDMTRRAADVLSRVALIAAEDTRRTRVLLEAIGGTRAQVTALHVHNESTVLERIVTRLEGGEDVALVSDAGTPLLSDPGFELVRAAWRAGIAVVPVPGASAVMAILSVCPLPVGRFRFEGFLPARGAQRRAALETLVAGSDAIVFFEAPHRMAACLADLARLIGDRPVMIGREMTKLHEHYLCGPPADLLVQLETGGQLRGEFAVVVPGADALAPAPEVQRTMSILARELSPAQASRIGAELLGLGKRELYALALALRGEEPSATDL